MSSKLKTKKETLKARGIRFSDEQWEKLNKTAALDKTGRTKASDVVRAIVDDHYNTKRKKPL